MKNWKTAGLVATIIIVLLIPLSVLKETKAGKVSESTFEFVGSQSCQECHSNEYNSWLTSHHFHAMAEINDSSALGDFNNAEYNDGTDTHRFFKKDNKFFVNTVGPDGNKADFEITHTFGYTPLQQYLIPFENGKFQCLHVAWNTEKGEWFNMSKMIYGRVIDHEDWLHWTNQAQNWNGMCAECHSTNLKKNYDHTKDAFNTTYSEISVGCEACHGPGSEHNKWAKLPEGSRPENKNFGLKVQTSGIDNETYVDMCARCHSRRGQVTNHSHDYRNIFDFMLVTNLNESYHSDGQILDEDYVYGSFTQSKMYHKDVQCNDCHNIHSGERLMDDNSLCYQCHKPDYYGTSNHHFHKLEGEKGEPLNIGGKTVAVGEGAKCIECHMPAQYYMGIDYRNDHSLRIPRPDLSIKYGTPNACTHCHTDKSNEWANKYFVEWYGTKRRPHYGEIIAQARLSDPNAELPLIGLIKDTLYPRIVRASAIDLLANYHSDTALQILQEFLDDPEPILRHSAISAYSSSDLNEFLADVGPMLTDPHRVIRAQAAIKLSIVPNEQIPKKLRNDYEIALNEYKTNNEYMADFPSGRMNLGIMYANTGNLEKAKFNYQKAIEKDHLFTPALLNLAIVHNQLGENTEAEKIYKKILKESPEYTGVYYSLGLLMAEQKKFDESVKYLELAGKETPENTRIFYNLSLLYQQLGDNAKAEQKMKQALSIEPENFDFLYALCHFYTQQGRFTEATKVGAKLKSLYPNNQTAQQLLDYVENARKGQTVR